MRPKLPKIPGIRPKRSKRVHSLASGALVLAVSGVNRVKRLRGGGPPTTELDQADARLKAAKRKTDEKLGRNDS